MDSISLRFRFNEIDGFIKIYDGIRYLVLLNSWYDKTCDRFKYLIIKPFLYMTKKSRQKLKYLENEKSF